LGDGSLDWVLAKQNKKRAGSPPALGFIVEDSF